MSGPLLVSYIVLWVLVAVLALSVLALYNHFGKMYLVGREGRARQGPDVGEAFAAFRAADIHGEELRIPTPGAASLVLFMSTTCATCAELLAELSAFSDERPEIATIVVCEGRSDAVRAWASDVSGVVHVVSDEGGKVALKQRIVMTPFAVSIDAQGIVRGKGVINGRSGLDAFAAIGESAYGEVAIAANGGRP